MASEARRLMVEAANLLRDRPSEADVLNSLQVAGVRGVIFHTGGTPLLRRVSSRRERASTEPCSPIRHILKTCIQNGDDPLQVPDRGASHATVARHAGLRATQIERRRRADTDPRAQPAEAAKRLAKRRTMKLRISSTLAPIRGAKAAGRSNSLVCNSDWPLPGENSDSSDGTEGSDGGSVSSSLSSEGESDDSGDSLYAREAEDAFDERAVFGELSAVAVSAVASSVGHRRRRRRSMLRNHPSRKSFDITLSEEAVFLRHVNPAVFKACRARGALPFVRRNEFVLVLRELLAVQDSNIARRAFFVFDEDGDGKVDLADFAHGISIVRNGTPREKMRFCFDMYDLDRSGEIDVHEVHAMLHEGHRDLWEQVIFTEQVIMAIDRNNDCALQREEFYDACENNPLIFECFAHGFPMVLERTSARSNAAGQAAQDVKKFSWATVRNLWTRMMHAAKMVDSVDFKGFQSVMKNFFSPYSELDGRLLERLFKTFDVDGDGSISLREFISGLSTILRGTTEQQARFYFRIFDLNDDGGISKDELYRILLMRQDHGVKLIDGTETDHEAMLAEVDAVLAQVDEDGNGEIDCDEYVKAALSNPKVLEVFEQCLFGEGAEAEHGGGHRGSRRQWYTDADARESRRSHVMRTTLSDRRKARESFFVRDSTNAAPQVAASLCDSDGAFPTAIAAAAAAATAGMKSDSNAEFNHRRGGSLTLAGSQPTPPSPPSLSPSGNRKASFEIIADAVNSVNHEMAAKAAAAAKKANLLEKTRRRKREARRREAAEARGAFRDDNGGLASGTQSSGSGVCVSGLDMLRMGSFRSPLGGSNRRSIVISRTEEEIENAADSKSVRRKSSGTAASTLCGSPLLSSMGSRKQNKRTSAGTVEGRTSLDSGNHIKAARSARKPAAPRPAGRVTYLMKIGRAPNGVD